MAQSRLHEPTAAHDLFAYNVFSISAVDFERIRNMLRGVFREIRSVITESQPEDTVAVLNLQAFRLFTDGNERTADSNLTQSGVTVST